jgi:hypothetical protein
MNWLRIKRPMETCEHTWGKPSSFSNFWLESYWTAKCRSCDAVVGRATQEELQEALSHFKRGTVDEQALIVDPEKQGGPQDPK